MKKFKYVSSLLAALGMCGVMGYAPEAWGQTATDESLPPIVMVLFDTSGSMDEGFGDGYTEFYGYGYGYGYDYGDGYTRLTRAMAQLAGTPKVSKPGWIKGSKIRLPRAYKKCEDGVCDFAYKCIIMDRVSNGSNLGGYKVAKVPFQTLDEEECLAHDYYNDYNEDGVLHAYLHTVKFGFVGMGYEATDDLEKYVYGQAVKKNNVGWLYGKDITGLDEKYRLYKKNYSNIAVGVYTADPEAHAPTIYPVTSDEDKDIVESNKAVLTSIRSYFVGGGTPTGASLADLHHMMNEEDPDPGIVAQPIHDYSQTGGKYKDLENLVGVVDHKYHCRDKAIILVADGDSGYTNITTDGYFGQDDNIWEDAERLRKIGIKVYPIVYAYTNEPTDGSEMDPNGSGIGYSMNKVAWFGGTCRDKNGKLLDPEVDSYSDLMKETNVKDRMCYYNANNSDTLRSAFVTVLSDMLKGTISKTSVATTTAIGQKHNYISNESGGTWNNGYYNVYSGYSVTMGPVRNTVLQRTAIVCEHTGDNAGEFVVQDDQFLDLTNRLKCRLRGDEYCASAENTGYKTEPNACTIKDTSYFSSESAEPIISGVQNTCLEDRYIFTANYIGHTGNPVDRYAISTFGDNKALLKNVSIIDSNQSVAGVLPKALNSGTDELSTASDASFLLKTNVKADINKCTTERARSINEYYGTTNYLLSPYECVEDFDCGRVASTQTPRICDLGRCVDPGDFAKKMGCTSNSDAKSGEICIGKYWRKKGNKCTSHSGCGVGEVCHAGTCTPGTVYSCDIRQFMASVPLGTIEYATPLPVAPPTKAYKSTAYRKFSSKYWKRDSLLMVGANDGMLHAFVLGDNMEAKDYKQGTYNTDEGLDGWQSTAVLPNYPEIDENNHEGDELWGFIPKSVYKNLYKLTEFHNQYFVNSKPITADVQLSRITIDGDSWRTVLVGGFREGGRGYYALDITNPAKPFVLWEIDYQWQPWKTPKYPDIYENAEISIDETKDNQTLLESEQGYPFQLMGYSYTEPVITNLLINDTVEPVAILSGGRGNGNGDYDQVGKAVYIVKLFPKDKEDLLVKTFYFADQVTGSPEVFPNNFNSIAQHIYIGDAKGALYRLDVSGGNPELWGSKDASGTRVYDEKILAKKTINSELEEVDYKTERPIFNPEKMNGLNKYKYKEITFKPAVSLAGYLEGNYPAIQITYGTGSNDNFNVSNADRHYVATFIDMPDQDGRYQLNKKNIPCFEPKVILLNADVAVADDSVEDSNYGDQVYGVYSKDPVSSANLEGLQKMTGAALTHNYVSYFPTFVADPGSDDACASGHANIWKLDPRKKSCDKLSNYANPTETIQNVINNDVFDGKSIESLDPGTKVYGLEITNQMYCISDVADKKSKVLAPQLIAQTGVNTSLLASDAGSRQITSNKVNINSLAINLDAVRPEVSRVTWAGVYE